MEYQENSVLRSKKLAGAFPCFTSLCEADMVSLSDYRTLYQREYFNSILKEREMRKNSDITIIIIIIIIIIVYYYY